MSIHIDKVGFELESKLEELSEKLICFEASYHFIKDLRKDWNGYLTPKQYGWYMDITKKVEEAYPKYFPEEQ